MPLVQSPALPKDRDVFLFSGALDVNCPFELDLDFITLIFYVYHKWIFIVISVISICVPLPQVLSTM